MEKTRVEDSTDIKQLAGSLGPGVLTAIKSKLDFASREDYVKKSFDGRLVDVVLPLAEKSDGKIAEAIKWCIKQKPIEEGGEGLFITKNFYKKQPLYDAVNRFTRKERRNRAYMKCLKKAKAMIIEQLRSSYLGTTLTPLTITEDIELSRNLSATDTSCGIIATGTKEDNRDLIVALAFKLQNELPEWNIPALAITRQQIGKYVTDGEFTPLSTVMKERLVWCVDAATVLFESVYARPFIDEVLIHQSWYAGGMNDRQLQDTLMEFRCYKTYWNSADFSNYDSTIPSWLIAMAFDIVKEFFPRAHWSAIGWIANNFIHCKILMPDGTIIESDHGIPSGSYFTQIIGSLVNALIQLSYQFTINKHDEAAVKQNICLSNGKICASFMGDDGIVFTDKEIDREDFARYIDKMFGMECHPDKCAHGRCINSYPEYLKRIWTERGSDRNTLELVINMIHPERERTYEHYSPYHLIYSYYLAYPVAMKRLGVTERWLLEGMRNHGGVGLLTMIPVRELPGSLRARVLNSYDEWQRAVERAVELDNRYQAMCA